MYTENPADRQICTLIDRLIRDASRSFISYEDRAKLISQIAELRASMNPIIKVSE